MVQWLNVDFFRYALSIFDPELVRPHFHVRDISEIDERALEYLGIKINLFDLDNTVVEPYECECLAEEKLESLKRDFDCRALSNHAGVISDDKEQRFRKIEQNLGIKVVKSDCKKPNPKAFENALADDAENRILQVYGRTAMTGDRLFTDVLGANNFGLLSILVDPLRPDLDKWYVKYSRISERALYRVYGISPGFTERGLLEVCLRRALQAHSMAVRLAPGAKRIPESKSEAILSYCTLCRKNLERAIKFETERNKKFYKVHIDVCSTEPITDFCKIMTEYVRHRLKELYKEN